METKTECILGKASRVCLNGGEEDDQGLLAREDEEALTRLPDALIDVDTHFCPGCQHGLIHRLVAETLDEMSLAPRTIGVGSVGCSVFLYRYIATDCVEAAHGRATATATGLKRARPDCFVYTYQGDGDLAAIGTAEAMHAANRGERISVIFVNNTTYGMTGGQMAPTTLLGQKTTTTPRGRRAEVEGNPIRMAEIMALLDGVAYSARVAVDSPKNIRAAKKAVRAAFEAQERDLGFGFVEFLSTCPTNWRLDPVRANERIMGEMAAIFPLGVFRNTVEGAR